ncbi:Hypothetical protein PROPAUS_1018 [Propionibacterium australiense]|uniref:Uncharacterized protein n=1 Tax=Propionibacterium australiense TaxID=119981 RepID=A0A383S5I6_9ACTN|nr:Hypothetical protein PROPAUS_1018 [Propionibacterium australiense]
MSERPKELASKASVVQATEGSNPSVTATPNRCESPWPGRGSCQGLFAGPARARPDRPNALVAGPFWAGGQVSRSLRTGAPQGDRPMARWSQRPGRPADACRESSPASQAMIHDPESRREPAAEPPGSARGGQRHAVGGRGATPHRHGRRRLPARLVLVDCRPAPAPRRLNLLMNWGFPVNFHHGFCPAGPLGGSARAEMDCLRGESGCSRTSH